jgi:hypothetical protein
MTVGLSSSVFYRLPYVSNLIRFGSVAAERFSAPLHDVLGVIVSAELYHFVNIVFLLLFLSL